jgi:hypothetical protein
MRARMSAKARRLISPPVSETASLTAEDRAVLARLEATLERVEERLSKVEEIVGGRGVLGRTIHVQQGVASLLRATHLDLESLPDPERLTARRFRLLSQNEEDGLTYALLNAVGIGPRRFVELGSGTNGGNSGFLAEELGFEGLMVDGDADRAAEARLRFGNERVTVLNQWLERETIDALVREHGLAGEIDLLSIDIDGNDIWLWEALEAPRPRVVIIEYNSLFGPEAAVAVPYDPAFRRRSIPGSKGALYGASLAALERMGARKGYRLVAVEQRGANAFFVRDDLPGAPPAVSAARAYRSLDKHRLLQVSGYDVHAIAREQNVVLEEIAA